MYLSDPKQKDIYDKFKEIEVLIMESIESVNSDTMIDVLGDNENENGKGVYNNQVILRGVELVYRHGLEHIDTKEIKNMLMQGPDAFTTVSVNDVVRIEPELLNTNSPMYTAVYDSQKDFIPRDTVQYVRNIKTLVIDSLFVEYLHNLYKDGRDIMNTIISVIKPIVKNYSEVYHKIMNILLGGIDNISLLLSVELRVSDIFHLIRNLGKLLVATYTSEIIRGKEEINSAINAIQYVMDNMTAKYINVNQFYLNVDDNSTASSLIKFKATEYIYDYIKLYINKDNAVEDSSFVRELNRITSLDAVNSSRSQLGSLFNNGNLINRGTSSYTLVKNNLKSVYKLTDNPANEIMTSDNNEIHMHESLDDINNYMLANNIDPYDITDMLIGGDFAEDYKMMAKVSTVVPDLRSAMKIDNKKEFKIILDLNKRMHLIDIDIQSVKYNHDKKRILTNVMNLIGDISSIQNKYSNASDNFKKHMEVSYNNANSLLDTLNNKKTSKYEYHDYYYDYVSINAKYV